MMYILMIDPGGLARGAAGFLFDGAWRPLGYLRAISPAFSNSFSMAAIGTFKSLPTRIVGIKPLAAAW
jgi:hypothetical protein